MISELSLIALVLYTTTPKKYAISVMNHPQISRMLGASWECSFDDINQIGPSYRLCTLRAAAKQHILCHQPLKLLSLFAAWLFWPFQTKSHNMKAIVILIHTWSPYLPLTCLYGQNELLWVSVWHSGVFSWERIPARLPMQITWLWPPVGRFGHGLTKDKRKCEHKVVRHFVYILLSTCQWDHMTLAINRPDILLM